MSWKKIRTLRRSRQRLMISSLPVAALFLCLSAPALRWASAGSPEGDSAKYRTCPPSIPGPLPDGARRQDDPRRFYPRLCALLDRAATDPAILAWELGAFNHPPSVYRAPAPGSLRTDTPKLRTSRRTSAATADSPIVFAHGFGDSCFNDGFARLVNLTSNLTEKEAFCVSGGDGTWESDILSSYVVSMFDNVETFASHIREDLRCAGGFDAIGISQGNAIIRGYIAKYNDPPVRTFMSISGVNAGIAAVPHCNPASKWVGDYCSLLAEIAGENAYNEFVQNNFFPAGYYRDPNLVGTDAYMDHSQLAQWLGEGRSVDSRLATNFALTETFIWVLAKWDTMIWPREGEQWGAPDLDADDPFKANILPMNKTEWYTGDAFGLRTADEAGKFHFESFLGDHVGFSDEEYEKWLNKYFV